ncbi:MAG: hypothetical protein DRN04_04440 [Thermoprotei archaeon]|nr:MAG: hypothetical protein DRN04_04440 [Thermoprotei archaeon]
MVSREISLKVAEALQSDKWKGLARVSSKTLAELEACPGEVIEIEGSRKTVAVAQETPYNEKDLIRIDETTRNNAGVKLGELVKVRKIEVSEAQKVVLVPPLSVTIDEYFAKYVAKKLVGRAVVKGDKVSIPVLGHPIDFTVALVLPDKPVVVKNPEVVYIEQKIAELIILDLYQDEESSKVLHELSKAIEDFPDTVDEIRRYLEKIVVENISGKLLNIGDIISVKILDREIKFKVRLILPSPSIASLDSKIRIKVPLPSGISSSPITGR